MQRQYDHKLYLNIDAQQELENLSLNIKLARKRRKITLKEMSERTGVSISTLSRLESGDRSVSLRTLFQALSVLGLVAGFAELAHPDNDLEQVVREVRDTRRGKVSKKQRFNSDDLEF